MIDYIFKGLCYFALGLVITIVVIITLDSCSTESTNTNKREVESNKKTIVKSHVIYQQPSDLNITVKKYTIEGCEYVLINEYGYNTYSRWGGHKGNCKNPIHKTDSIMAVNVKMDSLLRKSIEIIYKLEHRLQFDSLRQNKKTK